jgi:hypothetical protein
VAAVVARMAPTRRPIRRAPCRRRMARFAVTSRPGCGATRPLQTCRR